MKCFDIFKSEHACPRLGSDLDYASKITEVVSQKLLIYNAITDTHCPSLSFFTYVYQHTCYCKLCFHRSLFHSLFSDHLVLTLDSLAHIPSLLSLAQLSATSSFWQTHKCLISFLLMYSAPTKRILCLIVTEFCYLDMASFLSLLFD